MANLSIPLSYVYVFHTFLLFSFVAFDDLKFVCDLFFGLKFVKISPIICHSSLSQSVLLVLECVYVYMIKYGEGWYWLRRCLTIVLMSLNSACFVQLSMVFLILSYTKIGAFQIIPIAKTK